MRSQADFGHAIVFLNDMAGRTQKQLANALKVKPKTISDWKAGKRKPNRSAMQALPGELGSTRAGSP